MDSAEFYYLKSLKYENHPNTYSDLAIIKYGKRKTLVGLQYLEKAIELDSRNWLYHIQKARFLMDIRDFDRARTTLQNILRNKPSDYWSSYTNFYLAIANTNDGQSCSSIESHLRKAELLRYDSIHMANFNYVEKRIREYCQLAIKQQILESKTNLNEKEFFSIEIYQNDKITPQVGEEILLNKSPFSIQINFLQNTRS